MSSREVVESIGSLLRTAPPGPWEAFGEAVYVDKALVATCVGARGAQMALLIAALPAAVKILSVTHPDAMAARVERLEELNADLLAENAALIAENADLLRRMTKDVDKQA